MTKGTDPNGPHMTVGELVDALSRFDRDRLVVVNAGRAQTVVKACVSVEPGGGVMIVGDSTLYANAIDATVEVSNSFASWVSE